KGAPAEVADRVRREVLEHAEKVYEPFDDLKTPEWLRAALNVPPGKLPDWVNPLNLPPVTAGERRLNDDQLRALLAPLQAGPRRVVPAVKEHADRAALDAFAWKLFELWLGEGAPSKERWAMTALGFLGGDAAVLKLTPLVRAWPGESQHQRAVHGLECLRAVG